MIVVWCQSINPVVGIQCCKRLGHEGEHEGAIVDNAGRRPVYWHDPIQQTDTTITVQ